MTDKYQDSKVSEDKDDKYHLKAPDGNVAVSACLIAVAFAANAYWLANNLTLPVVKMDQADIWKYQVVNTAAFVYKMVVSATNEKWAKNSQRGIVQQWQIAITPIGWAFAIWGVIYMFMLVFAVYQALPCSWVPTRNNDLIFGSIGYLFALNCFLQGTWLTVWQFSTSTAFVVAFFIIAMMLSTGLAILQYSMYAPLNLVETISLRWGFSIYMGWVTAAFILNISFALAASGLRTNEVAWGRAILCVAYPVYALYAFVECNPFYSLIFIWVLLTIRANQNIGKDNQKSVELASTCTILMRIHGVTLLLASGMCIYQKAKGTCTHGLLF